MPLTCPRGICPRGIEERGVDCNATGVCDGRRGKRCKLEGEI